MNDLIETIQRFFRHFDGFYYWLRNALKVYIQPKLFIESLIALSAKERTKRILEYFCFYESIILIISATLIDKIKFSLLKIPGLIILDAIFAIPLIIVILIALFIAGIKSPLKKSITYVLVMRIFYALPLQIFFFLFVFFENYVFYIFFWGGIQLFAIIILLLPPLFFANKNKQALFLLGSTIAIFLLSIFVYALVEKANPKSENAEQTESYFDPIFTEYQKYREKLKIIDEIEIEKDIDEAKKYSKIDEKEEVDIDTNKLRDNKKYHNAFMLDRIKTEEEICNKENSIYFDTNKERFEEYREFLNELKKYVESAYSAIDIIDLKKAIAKKKVEIEVLNEELNKYPKYKYDENKERDYSKIKSQAELLKSLNEIVSIRKLAFEHEQLKSTILKKEISLKEDETEILKMLFDLEEEAIKTMETGMKFKNDEINYYELILKMKRFIIL